MNLSKTIYAIVGCVVMTTMSACNGVFDGIYDEPSNTVTVRKNQLVVDATCWGDWYYIDFDSLAALADSGDSIALRNAQTQFTAYSIPMERAGEATDSTTGIFTYWFDVFGKGIGNNELRAFRPTASQSEPEHWSIAIHRNNVRTNGASVLETNYTSMDDLPENSAEFNGAEFTEDVMTQNVVWVDESQMLQSLIGCQRIKVNTVLSSWLKLDIPPMPPSFNLNNHVFIIRFPNGRNAAVQLENYMNSAGVKCWLTINYKYPY